MAEGLAALLALYCSCGILNDCRAAQEDKDVHVCTHTHMQWEMLFLMDEKRETGILSLSMTSFTNWFITVLIQKDHCNNLNFFFSPFLFLLTFWFVLFS